MSRIGIICASDTELNPFLPHIKDASVTRKSMLDFHEGLLGNTQVVAVYSGVCKVNAAIAAQILIDVFGVDQMINGGTAGGMSGQVKLFDTVVGEWTAYHDVEEDILTDFHPWLSSVYFAADQGLLEAAEKAAGNLKRTILFGKIVTGEQFIEDDRREKINEVYAPLAVDMETASIAHVCYVNQIPFLSVRTITDTADHRGIENFEKNCEQASEISAEIVMAVIAGTEASADSNN